MYTRRSTSKHIGPAWTIAAGVILLGIAGGLVYLVINGLATGQIMRPSRINPGEITRADNPYEFWMSELFFSYFVVLLVALAVRSFWRLIKRPPQ